MVSAAGKLSPPLVLFWYERMPEYIRNSLPTDWSAGCTEKGWMTAQSFYEYVANVFFPWVKMQNIQLPIVLFVDGHSSHMSLHLSTFCKENDIHLIALYPNATHVLQPLDVALFHTLKVTWKNTIDIWKFENGGCRLTKQLFSKQLKKAVDSLDLGKIMKNGFKRCGLLPFSADAVNYSLLSGKKNRINNKEESEHVSSIAENKIHLQFFEKTLDSNILEDFKSSLAENKFITNPSNQGLFNYWINLKKSSGILLFITY